MPDEPLLIAATIVLWMAAAYLLGLGIVALVRPVTAVKFLGKFAQSPRWNWSEAIVRGTVGLAFIIVAPLLPHSTLFGAGGWFLVLTAAAMPLLPALHQRVAARSVAAVAPYARWLGLGAVAGAGGLCALLVARLH